jgi:hypothetical protein
MEKREAYSTSMKASWALVAATFEVEVDRGGSDGAC